MLLPALTSFHVRFPHGAFHTFACLTFAFWQMVRTASHFAIILHQCNLFCHPALSQRPAHDPCFTLRLGSNKAEGLSSWVRRDSSFHRASLSFPFFTRAMTDDRKIQYAECTPIPGLLENVGVVPDARDNAGHCSLTPGHRTKGWLRPPVAVVPPLSKGEGSSTVPHSLSPHGSYGKASLLAMSAPIQSSWVKHKLCLCTTTAAPEP